MKRTLSVLFTLLLTGITASAQIQNGYVRSQGTSYNRTGSPLKGARVFIKGLNGSKVTATNGLSILILVVERHSLASTLSH